MTIHSTLHFSNLVYLLLLLLCFIIHKILQYKNCFPNVNSAIKSHTNKSILIPHLRFLDVIYSPQKMGGASNGIPEPELSTDQNRNALLVLRNTQIDEPTFFDLRKVLSKNTKGKVTLNQKNNGRK